MEEHLNITDFSSLSSIGFFCSHGIIIEEEDEENEELNFSIPVH